MTQPKTYALRSGFYSLVFLWSMLSVAAPVCAASPSAAAHLLSIDGPQGQSTRPNPFTVESTAQPDRRVAAQPTRKNANKSSLSSPQTENSSQTVNINTADAATLSQSLKGIGEKRAQAIIEYRTIHGPFASIEALDAVKGIGPATIEHNRAIIRVR